MPTWSYQVPRTRKTITQKKYATWPWIWWRLLPISRILLQVYISHFVVPRKYNNKKSNQFYLIIKSTLFSPIVTCKVYIWRFELASIPVPLLLESSASKCLVTASSETRSILPLEWSRLANLWKSIYRSLLKISSRPSTE